MKQFKEMVKKASDAELKSLKERAEHELLIAEMNDNLGGWHEIAEARNRKYVVQDEITKRTVH